MTVEVSNRNSDTNDDSPWEEGFWVEPKTPSLAFLALIGFLVVLIVRPAEVIPALSSLRLALTTFGLTLVLWAFSGKRTVFLKPTTNRFAMALLAAMIVSVPFSVWPTRSIEELVIFAKQLTVFFLIMNLLQSTASVTRLLSVLVLALSFHAVVVIKRYLAGEMYLDRVFGVAGGSFSDPNDLALSFVMIFPVTLHLAMRTRNLGFRCLWAIFALLFPAAIVATQSRGGLLGLMAASGVLVLESRRKLTVMLTLGVCGLVILAVTPSAFNRYESIKDYRQDESALTRLTVWKAGVRMWSDHPLTGVGVGAFSTAYGQTYRDPAFSLKTWYDAHSSPIKVMAELGTPGLLAWCGMVAAGLVGLYQIRRQLGVLVFDVGSGAILELAALCQTLRASLVGYLVCCVFLSRCYDWMLMLFLSLSVTCVGFVQRYVVAFTQSQDTEVDGPVAYEELR